MQAHITGGVVALWLSVVGVAAAQGHEGHTTKDNKANTEANEARENGRRGKQPEQAGASGPEARKAEKGASAEAKDKVKEAREATEEARASARAADEADKATPGVPAEQAKKGLARAEDRGPGADEFDGDPNSPEGKRHARRVHERNETWKRLREHMKNKDKKDRPDELDPSLKSELSVHARRQARLTRIRDLANEKKDAKVAAKVEALLERERVRHERRVEMLTAHTEPSGPEGR